MKIAVIGAGFVGLPLAAVLADFGNTVWIVRKDKEKNEALKKGAIHFYEPGLPELVQKGIKSGRLIPTTDYTTAIPESEVVFIAVGTPCLACGEADLSQVFEVAKEIGKNLKKGFTVVVDKSTVPAGTSKKVAQIISKYKKTEAKFSVCSCPEFLREGLAVKDTFHPDRIVVGSNNQQAIKILKTLHRKFKAPVFVTTPESAELIKYGANAFLSTKISFANAFSILCEKTGADVTQVMEGIGLDKRIGTQFFKAGLGYGGSCFPKDVKALITDSKKLGYDFKLLKAVEEINARQVENFVKKVVSLCGGSVKGKTLAVLGLAFKPETSDMREARSILVIRELKKKGAKILATDPAAISEAKKIISGVKFVKTPYEALKNADALLLVTEWSEFQKLDFKKVKRLMKTPIVVDGRNIYNRKRLEKLGFIYEGMGR